MTQKYITQYLKNYSNDEASDAFILKQYEEWMLAYPNEVTELNRYYINYYGDKISPKLMMAKINAVMGATHDPT